MGKSILTSSKGPTSKRLHRQMRITMYFGYGLFLLTLVALLASTFSWFYIYSDPIFQGFDMTLLFVSFAFTALAPLLVGYLVGDGATRTSSKLVHHYNGVLFGVLGVWLWLVMSMGVSIFQMNIYVESNLQNALFQIAPSALAAIITTVLGISYARSTRHQKPVIDYTPYRWTLFASVGGLVASFGVSALFSLQYGSDIWTTFLINVIIPLLLALIITLAGYWILGQKSGTVGERVVYSLVGSGFAIVLATVMGQLSSLFMPLQGLILWLGFGALLLTWATYLYLLRRSAR
ncbi:MAG: hypothetical protein ACOH18_03720 [Candidatus Saccharimonadaceae bacterium]